MGTMNASPRKTAARTPAANEISDSGLLRFLRFFRPFFSIYRLNPDVVAVANRSADTMVLCRSMVTVS